MGEGVESRYGEIKGDGSAKPGCREPYIALSLARRVERSSHFSSPDGVGARESYSSETVPIAMVKVKSRTTWPDDVTAKKNDYSRTWSPKYLVPRKGVENEAEGRVIGRSL